MICSTSSRIIADKIQLEMRPVELIPIIEHAKEGALRAALAKGVHVDLRLDPATGWVMGDPARLQQIVANLLDNAVKFTPAGGRVELRLGLRGQQAELVVQDTGIGIEPEVLPHIFERFRQADSRTTRRHGGLGLGLAIVRNLVERTGYYHSHQRRPRCRRVVYGAPADRRRPRTHDVDRGGAGAPARAAPAAAREPFGS